MSNRETYRIGQLGWEPPPPHVVAWLGVELVASSLMLLWPKGLGVTPGQRLVGRLGLDPLNTAWRHRQAGGAVSPLRRRRLNMARLPAAMAAEHAK